jgi:hypothetical protein
LADVVVDAAVADGVPIYDGSSLSFSLYLSFP